MTITEHQTLQGQICLLFIDFKIQSRKRWKTMHVAKYVEAKTKDFRLVITSPNYSTVVFTDPSIDHSSHFCGVIISKKFNMTVGGSKKPM